MCHNLNVSQYTWCVGYFFFSCLGCGYLLHQDLDLSRRQNLRCAENGCKEFLVSSPFALRYVGCENWFHGSFLNYTRENFESISAQDLFWICRRCHTHVLLDRHNISKVLQLSCEYSDNFRFLLFAPKVSTLASTLLLGI